MRRDVGDGRLNNKTSKVTHAGEQVGVATVVSECARCPQVDMQNKEGAGDRPGEDKFLILASLFVGQHTVRAHAHPGGDVAAHLWPEKTETEAVQCFEFLHVTGDGASMVGAEEVTPKGGRHNDEGKGLTAVAHRLQGDELPINDTHAVVAEVRAVGATDFVEGGSRPRGLGGNAMENKLGIGVGRVGSGPIKRVGRSVGVMKKDRDGIVTGAVIVIQGGENGVHGGVGEAQGGSEGKTGT